MVGHLSCTLKHHKQLDNDIQVGVLSSNSCHSSCLDLMSRPQVIKVLWYGFLWDSSLQKAYTNSMWCTPLSSNRSLMMRPRQTIVFHVIQGHNDWINDVRSSTSSHCNITTTKCNSWTCAMKGLKKGHVKFICEGSSASEEQRSRRVLWGVFLNTECTILK